MKNILILSGFDPTSGAGILRDVLAINSEGDNPLAVVTVNTAQNTNKVSSFNPVEPNLLSKQLKLLTADFAIDVIKIGLIHMDNVAIIIENLKKLNKKVVLDPIINASTNNNIGNVDAIRKILPYCYIITPNVSELQALSGENKIEKAVKKIAVEYILLTTTDTSDNIIIHKLFYKQKLIKEFSYNKLANNYHGSGCTLSSLIATKINKNVAKCCEYALNKTYISLKNGIKLGKNQYHPKI